MKGAQFLMSATTIILWGLNPVLTRLCSNIIGIRPYMIITTISTSVAIMTITTILQPSIWKEIQQKMFTNTANADAPDMAKRWVIALTDGILCLAVPQILYNIMLSKTASIAIVVTTTWYGAPILTSIISRYVFHQLISPLQFAGILVSLAGIVMMNIEEIIKPTITHAPHPPNTTFPTPIEEMPLVQIKSQET